MGYNVSIPFKRESSWKEVDVDFGKGVGIMFQFPSNGKVHGKFMDQFKIGLKSRL